MDDNGISVAICYRQVILSCVLLLNVVNDTSS